MKEAIDFGIDHCYGISDFKRVMMNQGYVVDINPRHKYWTIRSENSKKCVRMYRLGDDYSNDAILCRIKKQELYGLKTHGNMTNNDCKCGSFSRGYLCSVAASKAEKYWRTLCQIPALSLLDG